MQTIAVADRALVELDVASTPEAMTDIRPAGPGGPPIMALSRQAKHCPVIPEIKMPESVDQRGWGGARPGAGRPSARALRPCAHVSVGLRWYVLALHGAVWRDVVKAAEEGESRPAFVARPPFPVFHPTCRVMRRRVKLGVKTRVPVDVPMMPGYAFVQFDADVPTWGQLTAIPGVHAVLRSAGGRPVPVSEGDLDRLRKQAARDAKLNPDAMPVREKDAHVAVIDGPFAGQSGAVVHCDGFTTAVYGIKALGRTLTLQFVWSDLQETEPPRLSA